MRPLNESRASSKLPVCLLLLLVSYDLQLSAQQHQQIIPLHQLPQIGGGGGGQFADTCPAGAFLTGLILHAADDVDAIQMLCAARDGSLKPDMPWHGGTGGRPVALECPTNTPAILAVDVAAERFLQLQRRGAQRDTGDGRFQPVDELTSASGSWLSWDEAVEVEFPFALELAGPSQQWALPVLAPGGTDIESVVGGRLVRTRQEVRASLEMAVERDEDFEGLDRVTIRLHNTGAAATNKDDSIARSLIGTHVIANAVEGEFISLLDPPAHAAAAAARCRQHRCFPVLAGPAGEHDLLLVSPIILYDHPEIAEQSEGALYDSTEIDEILTLRVMTMTDGEKAQARATDPLAARIIDRCDAMSPEAMQRLHGVLRRSARRRPSRPARAYSRGTRRRAMVGSTGRQRSSP